MTSQVVRNDYLVRLLALQQDGKQSISAPPNWLNQRPLLEILTEIDDIVKKLGDSLLSGNGHNNLARWHFFIGSPGNGKSAAMGTLCRYLLSEKRCQIKDEQGCPIEELEGNTIPYALGVHEGNDKFISALIVQDASVVRNPFSPHVDPAQELMLTLEQAWLKGVSLIICANRGVIEKAHRDNHMNSEVNKKPWFKILNALVKVNSTIYDELKSEWEFDGKKTVFQKVKVSYSHLDNRSLLIGRDILDRLIQKAVDPSKWDECNACHVKEYCSFKANRDWLFNPSGRKKFIDVLRRAEVFSGQVIVFREALAIISLLLAGCSRDYVIEHPCSWIVEKVKSGDYFTLATRRIYMLLFTSFSPFGLEQDPNLRKKQVDALRQLQGVAHYTGYEFEDSLKRVTSGLSPSTDVGVTRLLGEGGILCQIDPCLGSLEPEFYGRWDSEYKLVIEEDNPLITSIERRCTEIWAHLEQAIEFMPGHVVPEANWALRRWSSNFLMHLGALLEGRTAWANELDQFLNILEIVVKEQDSRTIEEKRSLHELDNRLEVLFDTGSDTCHGPGSLQLSENVVLSGSWVENKLRSCVVASEQPGSLSLSIEFEGGERATLGAPMFLWLSKRANCGLDSRCVPSEFLMGAIDARIRAAAKGNYAFEDYGVKLSITTENGEQFSLTRLDGDVEVCHGKDSYKQE